MVFRRFYKRRRYSKTGRYRRRFSRYGYKRSYGRRRYGIKKHKTNFRMKGPGQTRWLRGPGNVKWGKAKTGKWLPSISNPWKAGAVGAGIAGGLYGLNRLGNYALNSLADEMNAASIQHNYDDFPDSILSYDDPALNFPFTAVDRGIPVSPGALKSFLELGKAYYEGDPLAIRDVKNLGPQSRDFFQQMSYEAYRGPDGKPIIQEIAYPKIDL